MEIHNIRPFYDNNSRILILGSFPSVKSREERFFYAFRQNRFWKVLAALFEEKVPETVEEKKQLLKKNRIALWDVIASCDIEGSSDSSIKNVIPNDISLITENADIRAVFLNGGTSSKYYEKYIRKNHPDLLRIKLPSTSPANARYSLEMLVNEWKVINEHLK